MRTNWIDTLSLYEEMVAEPDLQARREIYRRGFLEPWRAMMSMMAGAFGSDPKDEFGVARAWAWLLPEDLDAPPDTLNKLQAAGAWELGAQAMEAAAARFDPYADRLPFDAFEGWLVLADPQRADPIGRGYTGAVDWTQPRFVVQYDTPDEYSLPRLQGAVAHEMHHLVRLRLFPWDVMRTSVADYIVHEGLAESFAGDIFGEGVLGYYVTDFDDSQLARVKTLLQENLDTTGFNRIRGFIFGDTLADKFGFEAVGMPDFGGYAIGYRVVQAYLERSGRSIEEASFVPAADIVAESSYFD